jgi:hypothetical protein
MTLFSCSLLIQINHVVYVIICLINSAQSEISETLPLAVKQTQLGLL